MSTHNTEHTQSLRRVMGTPMLVLFGLAYMVPMTIFTTYGVVVTLTRGHLAAAYVITLAAMIFTALSYAILVKVVPSAGSAYSFTQHIFGGHVGFITGWTLMLDYLLLPLINYLLIGIYLHAEFSVIPTWAFTLASLLFVTVLNVIGITVVRNANIVLVGGQIVFVVVFVILAATKISAGESLIEPFYSTTMSFDLVVAGSAILCLSFLGFDAVSTMSEEAKDPTRTVPNAIILTTLIGGGAFILVSWISHIAHPNWAGFTNPDAAAVEIMHGVGGNILAAFFLAAYIAGATASAMASQASVSRILYAMGRDGVLVKRVFGYISPRFRTPLGAVIFVSLVSLLALVFSVEAVSSVISFGALFAFSLVNLSVIKLFLIDRRRRSALDTLRYGLVPLIGFVLTIWLWFNLSGHALILGLSWMAAGIIYLAVLTSGFRKRPPQVEFEESDTSHTPETT